MKNNKVYEQNYFRVRLWICDQPLKRIKLNKTSLRRIRLTKMLHAEHIQKNTEKHIKLLN